MPKALIVDPHFDLTFDGARSLRHCRLVWQNLNRMGVEFVERG